MPESAQDRTTVLAVITILGVVAILATVGVIALIWKGGVEAGELAVVTSIGSTSTGALAAMLASTRSSPPAAASPPYPAGKPTTEGTP